MEDFMEFIQTHLANDFGFSDDQTMETLYDNLQRLRADRMHLPEKPNEQNRLPPEIPLRPFGPILTRSIDDIKCDIDELKSRCSRANCMF